MSKARQILADLNFLNRIL